MKLSDSACRAAKPRPKPYKLADGHGLYLFIKPDAKKVWRQKYYLNGKEGLLTHGPYPIIPLSEARKMRDEARTMLHKGIDPSEAKKQAQHERTYKKSETFKEVALDWHETQKSRWSEDHAKGILALLEKNLFPSIGQRLLREVSSKELLQTLKEIEERGSYYTAGRMRALAGRIFKYGRIEAKCDHDPSSDLRYLLKSKKAQHYAALDKRDIPRFLKDLSENKARLFPRTVNAIKLSMLTFQRPGELRHMRVEEIDFERSMWVIPPHKMKMRRSHLIPLSRQAMDIVKDQIREAELLGSPWLFPSQRRFKQPMSDGTVNTALKRLGYSQEATAHGFRALARTTIREDLGIDSEVIERQLAHKASGPLGEAYDRAQFIEQRVEMMQFWADYIDKFQAK